MIELLKSGLKKCSSVTRFFAKRGVSIIAMLSVACIVSTSLARENLIDASATSVAPQAEEQVTVEKFPVYITFGEEIRQIETSTATVGEILSGAGFVVDEYDMIEPSLDTVITETAYIDFTDINYVMGSYTETIPSSVNTVYDPSSPEGTCTQTQGANGQQLVEYTAKVVNGTTVETVVNNRTTIVAPVNAIKTVGTAKPAVTTSAQVNSISTLTPASPIELDANGNPVKYAKHITVQATAYTYTGNRCATGVAPQPGYIAVNPNVIPYGTKMYIKSSDGTYIYGYAVAADTGGFVRSRPNNVDLFMSSRAACSAFGRRNVEIYILE